MVYNILFIGHTNRFERPYLDPSTRYRCFSMASALMARGHKTSVIHHKEFEDRLNQYLTYDYYVFHRPSLSVNLLEFLNKKKFSKNIIADFDDFIFSTNKAALTPACRFGRASLTSVARYLANNEAACQYFSRFSSSTVPLANNLKNRFKPDISAIIPNGLEPGFIELSHLVRNESYKKDRLYKFGYFAGTATHDADFELIAPSIANALKADPSARMLVLGPANIPPQLTAFSNRINAIRQVVPFNHLPYVMAQVDTVVAPLEFNEFTICKSGLKFFEAALVGCKVIATPIPDIDRFSSKLLRKCTSLDEWDAALNTPFELSPEMIEHEIEGFVNMVSIDNIIQKWERHFL